MTVPGWYPDPSNPQRQIYWDGKQWTQPTTAVPAPTPQVPSGPKPNAAGKWIGIGAAGLVGVVVVASLADNDSNQADELHLPPVRDGKFEFTLLTWNGDAGKLRVVNTGDVSWSYDGDDQKAVDAQGREFDCKGSSESDIQPGGQFVDSLSCLNGDVPIHHLEVHDSWLSLGTDLVLASDGSKK